MTMPKQKSNQHVNIHHLPERDNKSNHAGWYRHSIDRYWFVDSRDEHQFVLAIVGQSPPQSTVFRLFYTSRDYQT